jgi:hypothetical protein
LLQIEQNNPRLIRSGRLANRNHKALIPWLLEILGEVRTCRSFARDAFWTGIQQKNRMRSGRQTSASTLRPQEGELMNRTAKIAKQSVLAAMLVIVSVIVGAQFGANFAKHQVVGQTLEKSGEKIMLVDYPAFCPKC